MTKWRSFLTRSRAIRFQNRSSTSGARSKKPRLPKSSPRRRTGHFLPLPTRYSTRSEPTRKLWPSRATPFPDDKRAVPCFCRRLPGRPEAGGCDRGAGVYPGSGIRKLIGRMISPQTFSPPLRIFSKCRPWDERKISSTGLIPFERISGLSGYSRGSFLPAPLLPGGLLRQLAAHRFRAKIGPAIGDSRNPERGVGGTDVLQYVCQDPYSSTVSHRYDISETGKKEMPIPV